jgi:hypothetical protein
VRARERILSGKELKIVYDEPWFWKVSANRAVVRTKVVQAGSGDGGHGGHGRGRGPRPRPRIRMDDSSDGDEQLALPQQTFLPTTPDYPPPDDALEYDGAGAAAASAAAVDGTKTEQLHQLLQLPKVNRRVVPLKKEKEEKLVVEV